MKTILERFPILGLLAALGLTTAQLQGRQLATNPQTVMGVTLYSAADLTPPATGGNSYTYANENQRISLQQNGNTLTITYKSYGFNHDYSYNGTDSSHRVAAHAWGLFEKHTTSIYHNPYWIQLSANFWEGSIGSGYPRSNSINVYKWTAANPTLADIQAVNASAWAEYNELLAQEQDMAFNQDHVNPADFLVDFRISEGIAIGRRCLWMDTKGDFAGTGGGSVAETFTHTIPLTPDMNGKTIVPISWQKSHHTGSKDYDKWGYFIGPEFTLTAIVNPVNSIKVNNSGTITAYNDTPVVVSATVTPPDYENYTYGMRIIKWAGPQNEAPGSGGGQWVEVYSGSMLSEQQTWSGTIQPGLDEVPGKITYRLLSWQTGTVENANPMDCAIIVDNRPPSAVTLSLSGTSIEYGQGVVATGSTGDADGNLSGLYLWRTAPGGTPDHSVAAAWLGKTVSGSGAVITGTFMPSGTGAWQIHANSLDAAGDWGPGASATLAVAKATPVSAYDGAPLYLTAYTGGAAAIFSASFFNPHDTALPVPGTVTYHLVTDGTAGAPLAADKVFSPGSYTVRAGISASANYNQAQADATLTVTLDREADDNNNQVKDWIEHTLGLGVSGSNNAGENLEINIHTPVN